MSNFWVGVVVGACTATVLFIVLQFVTVKQNDRLRQEIAELSEKVSQHEETIKIYEFYNWHNMKFFDEKEE